MSPCYTIRMYQWLKADGSVLRTDTIKQFCEISGFSPSMARTLACGKRARLRGFCSTHPRAKRFRERFTTTLINIWTGERKILGPSVKKFAKDNGISLSECSLLINRKSLCIRGWMLERTWEAANPHAADSIFQKGGTNAALSIPRRAGEAGAHEQRHCRDS